MIHTVCLIVCGPDSFLMLYHEVHFLGGNTDDLLNDLLTSSGGVGDLTVNLDSIHFLRLFIIYYHVSSSYAFISHY